MADLSALNQAFAAHVGAQAAQIELLYEDAVLATHNFNRGNVELKKAREVFKLYMGCSNFVLGVNMGLIDVSLLLKAVERTTDARLYVAALLAILTLSLLFLDWFSG